MHSFTVLAGLGLCLLANSSPAPHAYANERSNPVALTKNGGKSLSSPGQLTGQFCSSYLAIVPVHGGRRTSAPLCVTPFGGYPLHHEACGQFEGGYYNDELQVVNRSFEEKTGTTYYCASSANNVLDCEAEKPAVLSGLSWQGGRFHHAHGAEFGLWTEDSDGAPARFVPFEQRRDRGDGRSFYIMCGLS
ncbi:MAG: hypothetical protein M1829_005077 [Trizodia sp. TS-e1964]|nr:MAG: hypothetical protein M1829_005077 [Trizodia sp. TS-e1964]